jgi:hypothetical protein
MAVKSESGLDRLCVPRLACLMRHHKTFEISGTRTLCIFIFGSIYGAYPWEGLKL